MPFQTSTLLETKNKVFQLKVSGVKVPEICKLTLLGKSTVYRILAEYDPKAKFRVCTEKLNLDFRSAEIISLYQSGLGSVAICQHLGIKKGNADTIIKVLRNNGIDIKPKGSTPTALVKSKDIQALYSSGIGSVNIGKHLNLSKSVVLRQLHRDEVQLRPAKRPSVRGTRERDKLFLAHKDYIDTRAKYHSRVYKSMKLEMSEFYQIAYVASIRACELWANDGRGSFKTYVCVCIQKSISSFVGRELKHRHRGYLENNSAESLF